MLNIVLCLRAIAEKENLKFTKEEVETRAEIAASYGVDKAELLKSIWINGCY